MKKKICAIIAVISDEWFIYPNKLSSNHISKKTISHWVWSVDKNNMNIFDIESKLQNKIIFLILFKTIKKVRKSKFCTLEFKN